MQTDGDWGKKRDWKELDMGNTGWKLSKNVLGYAEMKNDTKMIYFIKTLTIGILSVIFAYFIVVARVALKS